MNQITGRKRRTKHLLYVSDWTYKFSLSSSKHVGVYGIFSIIWWQGQSIVYLHLRYAIKVKTSTWVLILQKLRKKIVIMFVFVQFNFPEYEEAAMLIDRKLPTVRRFTKPEGICTLLCICLRIFPYVTKAKLKQLTLNEQIRRKWGLSVNLTEVLLRTANANCSQKP